MELFETVKIMNLKENCFRAAHKYSTTIEVVLMISKRNRFPRHLHEAACTADMREGPRMRLAGAQKHGHASVGVGHIWGRCMRHAMHDAMRQGGLTVLFFSGGGDI